MGNYKFRLSDMMPNAWFYKLKDMSKPTKTRTSKKKTPIQHHQQSQPHFIQHRNSYYFTSTDSFKSSSDKLYNSPINPKVSDRKSSKTRSGRRSTKSNSKQMSSSVTSGCSCHASIGYSTSDSSTPPSPETNFHQSNAFESRHPSCNCRITSSATDIIIDVENSTKNSSSSIPFDGLDPIPELELPPILTKPPPKFNEMVSDIKNREVDTIKLRRTSAAEKIVQENTVRNLKQHRVSSPRSSVPGVKIRASSPKIASKKIQAYGRKSTSNSVGGPQRKRVGESFAIVKSSLNPQRDFKESMVEMIVENNIRASKDLEDLLACYLSLNSNEYHDLIVKVFEQIWFDLTDLQL